MLLLMKVVFVSFAEDLAKGMKGTLCFCLTCVWVAARTFKTPATKIIWYRVSFWGNVAF